jgi:hypothetical protein
VAVLLNPFVKIVADSLEDFHPKILKRLCIVSIIVEVVRPELDHVPGVQQALDDRRHAPGVHVLMGLGNIVVDDQRRPTIAASIARPHDVNARRKRSFDKVSRHFSYSFFVFAI